MAKKLCELQHENKVLRERVKALEAAAVPKKLSPTQLLSVSLAARLEPLAEAMAAVHLCTAANEKDKERVAELLRQRSPLWLAREDPVSAEKLAALDEKRHEVGRRIELFPTRINKLGEAVTRERRNFAGV